MNISSLIGKKIDQTQAFLEDGTRVPVSIINVAGNTVVQLKNQDKEGYSAIQVGFGTKRKPTKPIAGHIKKAGIEKAPRFFREIRVDDTASIELGSVIAPVELLEAGDVVDVIGTSKGKGYAGVVKRHHFKGGPKTHGQSDRHRAPGSSGQGTTPGRVYRGKRMSGRMGDEQVTIRNLTVLKVEDGVLFVKGLIPGAKGSIVMVARKGKNKKFIPLFEKKIEAVIEEVSADSKVAEEIEKEVAPKIVEEIPAVEEAQEAIQPVETETIVEEPKKEPAVVSDSGEAKEVKE